MHYLAGELRALGVPLVLSLFVRDDVDEIVEAVHYARRKAELVLTTGGVGPTHDDVTLRAIASAFERKLVREPSLVEAIRSYYGERVNEEILRMAEVPQGAELLQPAPFFVPVFRVENVFCFPGVPEACRLLFDAWKETLRQEPYHLLRCELDVDEGDVAPVLSRVQDAYPSLELGSYPRFDGEAPYRVLVTLEGKDRTLVDSASDELIDQLRSSFGEGALVRVLRPESS
jgi:molybdenum cofactor synthesis domain-containing protein